jgi:hypothetical protein
MLIRAIPRNNIPDIANKSGLYPTAGIVVVTARPVRPKNIKENPTMEIKRDHENIISEKCSIT